MCLSPPFDFSPCRCWEFFGDSLWGLFIYSSVFISHPSQKIKFLMVVFGGSSYMVEISPFKGGKYSIYLIAFFFGYLEVVWLKIIFFPCYDFCTRKLAQRREIMRFLCFSLSDGITSLWDQLLVLKMTGIIFGMCLEELKILVISLWKGCWLLIF